MRKPLPIAYALLLLATLAYLQGCATVAGPVRAAETTEQKAFALYGTFVVFEEQGAKLVVDSRIDVNARRAIQRADLAAKPVADDLLEAALELNAIREDFNASDSRLEFAARNVESIVLRMEPLLAELVRSVKGAR